MEKYPDIQIGQFTVQFFDRNTGTILDHDFNIDRNDTPQKVYSIHNKVANKFQIICALIPAQNPNFNLNPPYKIPAIIYWINIIGLNNILVKSA